MDIFQIVAFGLISALLAMTLKEYNKSFALLISICASLIIFFALIPKLASVLDLLQNISSHIEEGNEYVLSVVKIIGIAYAAEFGAQICTDAGETSIASKVEMSGKILIMAVSAPIITRLLSQVLAIVP